jgi:hypothetical protein
MLLSELQVLAQHCALALIAFLAFDNADNEVVTLIPPIMAFPLMIRYSMYPPRE